MRGLTSPALAAVTSTALDAGPQVLDLLDGVVLPGKVTGGLVSRFVRRDARLGIWRRLRPESRALLLVARRFSVLRSPVAVSALRRAMLEVELLTLRGRALLFGVLVSLRDPYLRLSGVFGDVAKLLAIGISYLSNPPAYRYTAGPYVR
jgi:hypothetical protein